MIPSPEVPATALNEPLCSYWARHWLSWYLSLFFSVSVFNAEVFSASRTSDFP